MQPFNFGIRQSSAESVDDNRSRYAPSSVYSGGVGPTDDSPALGQTNSFMSGALRGPYEEQQTPRFPPSLPTLPRNSAILNINDPVAMHLLTETAMSDSRDFEVLSFQELEDLKRQRRHFRNRVETTKRKLALESKLRDAALSLNRLYSTRDKTDSGGGSPKRTRRSLLGHKADGSAGSALSSSGSGIDALHRADDAYTTSSKKVEELTQELVEQEQQLHQIETRLLEHTAGILQLTHKGLKKNIRRTELPRSPESMTSQQNGRSSGLDGVDDFDERSLYQIPDYVTSFGPPIFNGTNTGRASHRDTQALGDVALRLQELNSRLHVMITQAGSQAHFDPPPQLTEEDMMGRIGAQIQAHLGYLSQGLEALETVQARAGATGQESLRGHEDQLEDVNMRLHDMLERTNSVSHSPLVQQEEPRGKDLQSQIAFSSVVLDRLNQRVETLVEQKDILSRQIQQQRDIHSKSDADRDARIQQLTEEVEQFKRLQAMGAEEAQHSREHITLLMEQLDLAKQESTLLESQRGASDNQAVAAERAARKEIEDKLMADLQAQKEEHSRLQSDMIQLRQDSESKTQQLLEQLEQSRGAKTAAEAELSQVREEMQELEAEVVRAQTELTMVKAELDGAYGTRAQRAADVSMNPVIQKEIDHLNERNTQLQSQLDFLNTQHETKGAGSAELQNKVNTLQQELKEIIEEYEIMTKHSIDDEKERERLEELIDTLQERCETLESQLSEEKVKWLGAKVGSPVETTSTMVLKNEFKKMMRETRMENLKALKTEQEERRRLENIIKSLKKDMQHRHLQKDAPATPSGSLEVR